jgi:uncharacterized UPF0146 family protein
MAEKSTQMSDLIMYLKTHPYITRYEALLELGIANLTAVVSELRRRGIDIVTVNVTTKNRYGRKVVYARYYLKEND